MKKKDERGKILHQKSNGKKQEMEGRKIKWGNKALRSFGILYNDPPWNWTEWIWSMKCIFKLIICCWCYKFSSWKEAWQSLVAAFSALLMRHLRPRKAKRSVWGEAHSALPLRNGASFIWFPLSTPLPVPAKPSTTSGEWLLPAERKVATEGRAEAKERGVLFSQFSESCLSQTRLGLPDSAGAGK